MSDQASATVHMDPKGRVTIPQEVRRALDVDGEQCYLNLDISVIGRAEDEE